MNFSRSFAGCSRHGNSDSDSYIAKERKEEEHHRIRDDKEADTAGEQVQGVEPAAAVGAVDMVPTPQPACLRGGKLDRVDPIMERTE